MQLDCASVIYFYIMNKPLSLLDIVMSSIHRKVHLIGYPIAAISRDVYKLGVQLHGKHAIFYSQHHLYGMVNSTNRKTLYDYVTRKLVLKYVKCYVHFCNQFFDTPINLK